MPNYQNGKIYKLQCNVTAKVYIGSTTLELCQRKAKHAGNYKSYCKGKNITYYTSFEIIKGGNYSIVLLELFPCLDKSQLEEREGQYVRNTPCVNKYVPGRTDQERNIRVKCECGIHFMRDNLSRHVKTQNHQNYLKNNSIVSDGTYKYTLSDQPIIRVSPPVITKPKIKLTRKVNTA